MGEAKVGVDRRRLWVRQQDQGRDGGAPSQTASDGRAADAMVPVGGVDAARLEDGEGAPVPQQVAAVPGGDGAGRGQQLVRPRHLCDGHPERGGRFAALPGTGDTTCSFRAADKSGQ